MEGPLFFERSLTHGLDGVHPFIELEFQITIASTDTT
jgi:hypothetical protein